MQLYKDFILSKKDTLQHFKIREKRFAVLVFDPMSSLETTITYSKRQKNLYFGTF